MTILDEIVAWKRDEIIRCMQDKPLALVQAEAEHAAPPRDFLAALCAPAPCAPRVSLIAEIKRASPSKGAIRPDLDPVALARVYAGHGAAAISVLTDQRYFGGSLDDLRAVRHAVDLPLLRKDFILDPYQVYEARAAGADAVLLIVAALPDPTLSALYALTRELNMTALIEVHNADELQRALRLNPRLIGINNRDLATFTVDLETTARLRPLIPSGICVVAESGIHTRADVERLQQVGVNAILVGEALVRAADPAQAINELTQLATLNSQRSTLNSQRSTLNSQLSTLNSQLSTLNSQLIYVKICGLTNLKDAYCAADAGADMLGFIFYPPSPRYISPAQAGEIVRALRAEFGPLCPRFVGVWVNAPVEEIRRVGETVGLDLAQLHGDEPPQEVGLLAPRAFKAIRPQTAEEAIRAVEAFRPFFSPDPTVPDLLIDAWHPTQRGGTGEQADPGIAQALAARCRLLLAGGLTPDNVAEAVRRVRPWGVDVSGGVEASKGKKDHGMIKAFIQAAKSQT